MPLCKVTAIIPAAGRGKRMGTDINKQFIEINKLPVLVHTLQVFAGSALVDDIIVVSTEEEIEICRQIVTKYNVPKISHIVAGGSERQHSVYNGLICCSNDTEFVIIHDGARPLVTKDLIKTSIDSARLYGAVSVAVPVKDTVKKTNELGIVTETPDRHNLWLIQTPQAFKYDLIMSAHKWAQKENYVGTDDASLIEKMGHDVRLIRGSYENIKITTPEDILIAEVVLTRRSVECV